MTDEERRLLEVAMAETAGVSVEEVSEIINNNIGLLRETSNRFVDGFINDLQEEIEHHDILTTDNPFEVTTDTVGQTAAAEAINEESDANYLEEVSQLNSGTTTQRFSGADWFEKIKTLDVLVGGAGGIGSFLAFFLSRTGVNRITIYDDDVVEKANLAGQLFSIEHVGRNKVDSVSDIMEKFSEYSHYTCIGEKFIDNGNPIGNQGAKIMMCGFDNMKARKDFFNVWLRKLNYYKQRFGNDIADKFFFVDGRLNAEEFQVFAIRGNDTWAIDDYMKNKLFNDEDADSEVCSYKQTTFCAAMIASIMINSLVNFVTNLTGGVRSVPYFTYYDARSMLFTKQ